MYVRCLRLLRRVQSVSCPVLCLYIEQPTHACLNTHINISWVKVWIKSNKTQKININKSRITRYFLCSLVSSVQAQVLSAKTRYILTFVLVKTLCGHYYILPAIDRPVHRADDVKVRAHSHLKPTQSSIDPNLGHWAPCVKC